MEIEREKGKEIKRARKLVRRVPTRKENAPNSPFTGSQVFPNKNLIPNFLSEGKELTRREKKTAPTRTTKIKAEM